MYSEASKVKALVYLGVAVRGFMHYALVNRTASVLTEFARLVRICTEGEMRGVSGVAGPSKSSL